MKIKELRVYPIKSLRGISLPGTEITARGIPHDRQFMLLKDNGDDTSSESGLRYENLIIASFPAVCLFTVELKPMSKFGSADGIITITYNGPSKGIPKSIDVPLYPGPNDVGEPIDVDIWESPCKGIVMAKKYCDWFSACFGYDVLFIYQGKSLRQVLGSVAPNAAAKNPQRKVAQEQADGSYATWLGSMKSSISAALSPTDKSGDTDYKITFQDFSPYLFVSETSLQNVSSRLPTGVEMDITKFRPNIILEGATEAWEEDYWRELTFYPTKFAISDNDIPKELLNGASKTSAATEDSTRTDPFRIQLTTNCVRCTSLNVDHKTGEIAKGALGTVLKLLQKDRRVDKANKWSPVFGRYGFLAPSNDHNSRLFACVGDEVQVTKCNKEITPFVWPGQGQTPKTDLWALEPRA